MNKKLVWAIVIAVVVILLVVLIANTGKNKTPEGDIGTIAIRTNLSLDKLVKDAAEYAYLELKFSTQTQKTTPMTPEIGKLRTSYHGENYSVVISRKNLA